MVNWYFTSFETSNKDIVGIIEHGQTIDFYYDENTESDHCRLAWGLCSIDGNKVEEIVTEHKSSFHIISTDYLSNIEQEWAFKNRIQIIAEVKKIDDSV